MLNIRRSEDRGLAQHGWLTSRHTFSFADYCDPRHMGFGVLRVINEDWIQGGRGFGAHPHRDMEIITYVVAGTLAHQDSLGNKALIRPNEIQRMTAGTGITHSEVNPDAGDATHLFQIWIKPERAGLAPSYGQQDFAGPLASGKPVLVVSQDGRQGSIAIHQDVNLHITRFHDHGAATFPLLAARSAWVQVIAGPIVVNGQTLATGDAAAVTAVSTVDVTGDHGTEFMIFDLKSE